MNEWINSVVEMVEMVEMVDCIDWMFSIKLFCGGT